MLMFRFPTDPERKRQWVAAIRREGWQPNEHSRICQEHFITEEYACSLRFHLCVLLYFGVYV